MNEFKTLYDLQVEFQKLIGNTDIPKDDPQMLAHHLLGLVTEVGEVAQADKRWKLNKRNNHYDREEKIEEIADVMIFILNILIYSGISPDEALISVENKIKKNIKRYVHPE